MAIGAWGVARWCRVWLLIVWACAGWAGLGQSSVDGAIGGRVMDAHGDSVAGARVSVKSAATGVTQAALSGSDGGFLVGRMTPGTYEVVLSSQGFDTVVKQVTVELGAVANVDARLAVEQVVTLLSVDAAPVSVAGAAPAADVAAPAVAEGGGDAITTAEQVEGLPTDGRRWQSFALLLPGANAGSVTEGEAAVSFRGLAVTQNASVIDGASDDQSFGSVARGTGSGAGREGEEQGDSGGELGAGGDGARAQYGRHAGAAYTFAQGAVQEFRTRVGKNGAGEYSALDGHAAGGVVTTISKSGTTAVHGSGFYLVRDSAWGATNPFSLATHYADGVVTSSFVKPEDFREQFGASVGGPVRMPRLSPGAQPKLFYFATVDAQRRRNPGVSSPGYAGFYQLTATQQALLGNRGVSQSATNKALNYLDSLTGTVMRREDQEIGFGSPCHSSVESFESTLCEGKGSQVFQQRGKRRRQ